MHAKLREKLAEMNTYAQENISGNRVVKAFAREEYEKDKFDKANTSYRDTNRETALVWVKFYPAIEGMASAMSIALLVIGGLFLIYSIGHPDNVQLTMGQFVAFSGLIWAIQNPMRMLGNIMNEFQRFSAAADKVMEIYYSEPEIVDAPDAIDHPGSFKGEVEFKNVSFMYSDADILSFDASSSALNASSS